MVKAKIDNYLDSIQQILATLDKFELDIFRNFIEVGQRRNKSGNTSRIVSTLLSNPDISVTDLRKSIGRGVSEEALYKSLTRVKEKLLESLVLDVNLRESGKYSSVFTTSTLSRKKIMQAVILFSRGLEKEGRKLLERVIDQGKKYELYDELFEVMHWVRNENGLRFGRQKYDKYTQDMIFFQICRDGVYEARNIYYDYYMLSDRSGEVSVKRKWAGQAVESLKIILDQTDSSLVRYYYYLLLSELYALKRESEKTDELAEELLSLLRTSPALKMDLKVGIAHSDIADMMLSCEKYDQAFKFGKKALYHFEKSTYNYLIAEEMIFKSLFLQGEMSKAKVILNRVLEDNQISNFPLIRSKFLFYQSCFLFVRRDFAGSIKMLSEVGELKKDKYSWNIVLRILLILNFIEGGKYDVVESEIDSFRKYMNRIKKRGDILPRYTLIVELLVSLRNNGLDFEKTYKENKANLRKLSSQREGFRWDSKSPELISFQQWFLQFVN